MLSWKDVAGFLRAQRKPELEDAEGILHPVAVKLTTSPAWGLQTAQAELCSIVYASKAVAELRLERRMRRILKIQWQNAPQRKVEFKANLLQLLTEESKLENI